MALSRAAISRRHETEADADFLFGLFCASRSPVENLPGLDPDLRGLLLRQQFAGQTSSYRAMHPVATFDIVEQGEVPIGRIVVETAADAINLVDIALLPAGRGRGIGTELLAAVCEDAQVLGLPVRLRVLLGNKAALRLYRRLGFASIAAFEIDTTMEWRPIAYQQD